MLNVVLFLDPSDSINELSAIAAEFGLTVTAVVPVDQPYLAVLDGRLSLHFPLHPKWQPLSVDFQARALQHRLSLSSIKKESLARAVGMRGHEQLSVIDATAGLGQDSYLMASLGAKVCCVERNAVLAALLTDGLNRARAAEKTVVSRLSFIHQSAHDYLRQTECRPDVVYLDPMYPQRDAQSAKQKKALQMLRLVVGEDEDADLLLELAKKVAKKRVVVKRPKKAAYLAGVEPDYQLTGTSSRFDVYLLAP